MRNLHLNTIGFAIGLSFLALGVLSERIPILKFVFFALIVLVLATMGVIGVFFPRLFREYARSQRPTNWEQVFGLNVFWAIIDEPIYILMVVVSGLISLGMALLVVWLVMRPILAR